MKVNALLKFLLICSCLSFATTARAQCLSHSTVADWRDSVSKSNTSNSIEDKYRYWYCNFRKYSGENGNSRVLKFPFPDAEENDQHLFIKRYTNSSLVLLKETYSDQPAFNPNTLEEEANYAARSLLILPSANGLHAPSMNKDRYDTLFRVINTLSQIHQLRLDDETAVNKEEIVRIREFYDFVSWRCILQNELLEDFSKTLDRAYPFSSRMIQSRINILSVSASNQMVSGKCNDITSALVL